MTVALDEATRQIAARLIEEAFGRKPEPVKRGPRGPYKKKPGNVVQVAAPVKRTRADALALAREALRQKREAAKAIEIPKRGPAAKQAAPPARKGPAPRPPGTPGKPRGPRPPDTRGKPGAIHRRYSGPKSALADDAELLSPLDLERIYRLTPADQRRLMKLKILPHVVLGPRLIRFVRRQIEAWVLSRLTEGY